MTITPEQFNYLATKDDLRAIREEMATKKDVAKIMTTLDSINKTLSTRDDEKTANISAHNRFQRTLDDHEVRITKIEKAKVAV